eukprot:TRINITY_DN11120_c0_g1_i6.p1 TRINITY_DN11120_c0_g1~~TRINITY_DN11120_c0_g1_i6.p1  ORF type:complete len:1550 (-),score=454.30 TRINITY_DN11120_c0_g1_i6:80-4675(-)
MSLKDDGWIRIQQKTFTRWVNSFCVKRGFEVQDITKDFGDGRLLIRFMEALSGDDLGKYNTAPKLPIQKIQNINVALKYIQDRGVRLIGISAEDIHSGNLKLILGMIWTLIMKFTIEDISEGQATAKDALLMWCRRKTKGYRDVKIDNFHTNWQDGMALCALIHAHRPNLIPFDSLQKENKLNNLNLGFNVAFEHLGVVKLLDAEDIVDAPRPDEKAIMSYISQLYHVFAGDKKNEQAARRITQLIDFASMIESMEEQYNVNTSDLIDWMKVKAEAFKDRHHDNTLLDVEEKIGEMKTYKTGEKIERQTQKNDLEALLNQINLKLKSNNRQAFCPSEGLTTEEVDGLWNILGSEEVNRDEWLRNELAKQMKLNLLQKKFDAQADKLEVWINDKEEFLALDDAVASLREANSKVKKCENFIAEYASSENRLKSVEDLCAQISELGNTDSATAVRDRTAHLAQAWHGLEDSHKKKLDYLRDLLLLEQEKEKLRLLYAEKAKEYVRWVKDAANTLSTRDFGTSLAAVEDFLLKLESEDASFKEENDKFKATLDGLWDQLQAHSVTDNRYTFLTNDDIANNHQHLLEALQQRRAAWEEALKRQQEMEDKCKEFAALASAFVDHLAQRKNDLTTIPEPSPTELELMIKDQYNEGKEEAEKLDAIKALDNEMSSMGIITNPHTAHTVPSLQKLEKKFASEIRFYQKEIAEEKYYKSQYDKQAREYRNWIIKTQQTDLNRPFDNTLHGARKSRDLFNFFVSVSAEKDIDRHNIQTLYEKITSLLSKNQRPPFLPPINLSPSELDDAKHSLHQAQDAASAIIDAELDRQQLCARLAQSFFGTARNVTSLLEEKVAYLNIREEINTIDEARLQVSLLKVNKDECEIIKTKINGFAAIESELKQLNYHSAERVSSQIQHINTQWETLNDLFETKKARLDQALKHEEKKEDTRLLWADKARDYNRFVSRSIKTISDSHFGTSLEHVQEYKVVLDHTTGFYLNKSNEFRADLQGVLDSLHALGVTDNRHTSLDPPKIDQLETSLQDALTHRQQAYDKVLALELAKDEKRKVWAKAATAFIELIEDKKNIIDSIELTADPDHKIQIIKETYGEGKDTSTALHLLETQLQQLQNESIFGNKHSQYTVRDCRTRNSQWKDFVENYLAALNEDKALLARKLEQEEENKQRDEALNLTNEFENYSRLVEAWLDELSEFHNEPLTVSSYAEVETISNAYHLVFAKHDDKQKDLQVLNQIAGLLESKVGPAASINSKWNQVMEASKLKRDAYENEKKVQQENAQLCSSFATLADSLVGFLDDAKARSGSISGDLQGTISALRQVVAEVGAKEKVLSELQAIHHQLNERKVFANPHTRHTYRSLSSYHEQVSKTINVQLGEAEKAQLAKDNTGLSPQQFDEFKESFNHFSRKTKGFLEQIEFFGALQSLGDDKEEQEACKLFIQLDQDKDGKLNFKEFTDYMLSREQDKDTAEQVLESFRMLAGDKDFITENELKQGLDKKKADYLLANMPRTPTGDLDYVTWVRSAYEIH